MTFPLPRAAEMSSGDEQIWMREVGKKGSSYFSSLVFSFSPANVPTPP